MPRSKSLTPDVYRLTVLRRVTSMLERYDADGFFTPRDPRAYYLYNQQFIYPLAYFWKTRFLGNRYCGDPKILAQVRALGDHIVGKTDADGNIELNSFGYKQKHVDQRLLAFWAEAYELVKPDLPASTCHRWEAAMRRSCHVLAEKIEKYLVQSHFNSYSFGTGPNHAILYAVALCLGGRVLRHRGWQKLAEEFTDRYVAFQTPEGYWPEGDGPVTIYNSVSLAGVARMATLLGKKSYWNALERAWRYVETISYPDFTFVGLMDRRTRHHKTPFLWGNFGFSCCPDGRVFALEAARARLDADEPFDGEECARWLENYVHFRRGTVPRFKLWQGWRWLDRHTAFQRRHGWQACFSVSPVVFNPNNPFVLDYQNVFSLWHKEAGPIVSCSQDKFHPEHGSFCLPEGKSLGTLYGGRIGDLASPPYVEALYADGFVGRVEVELRSSAESILAASQTSPHRTGEEIRFNLPLCATAGDKIRIGKKSVTLSAEKLDLSVAVGTPVSLGDGKVSLVTDAMGTLRFPCLPFNSYSKDNSSDLTSAFLRWEFPLKGDSTPTRIIVRVG